MPADLPLSVWPTAQRNARSQRKGRYVEISGHHPAKMLPAIAQRAIATYTRPGDLVLDPMAGIGSTLVEAVHLGRDALGVELEDRWVVLATENLDHMLAGRRRRLAEVRQGDGRRLPEVLGGLARQVDLIVTSPPYACDAGVIDKRAWLAGKRLCPDDTLNYSTDRANLGHARGAAYETAMAEIYAACHAVLRPGGHLVVVTKNTRRKGRTLDLAGLTVALATAAGFTYRQHVIALHAAIRDGDLAARPSYWQMTQIRHARSRGEPAHLVAHEDVTAYAKNQETADAR